VAKIYKKNGNNNSFIKKNFFNVVLFKKNDIIAAHLNKIKLL